MLYEHPPVFYLSGLWQDRSYQEVFTYKGETFNDFRFDEGIIFIRETG